MWDRPLRHVQWRTTRDNGAHTAWLWEHADWSPQWEPVVPD